MYCEYICRPFAYSLIQCFNRALCIVNKLGEKIKGAFKAVLIEHYVLWI